MPKNAFSDELRWFTGRSSSGPIFPKAVPENEGERIEVQKIVPVVVTVWEPLPNRRKIPTPQNSESLTCPN